MSTTLLVLGTAAVIVAIDQLARRRDAVRGRMSAADWQRLARRCQLTVRDAPPPRHLAGAIHKTDVWVELVEEHSTLSFRLCAGLRVPLPRGFQLGAGEGGLPLRNPILKGVVQAQGGPMVVDLLDSAVIVGPLMTVLHQWPHARVDALGVHIAGSLDRPRAQLPAVIGAAVALAEAIGAAWPDRTPPRDEAQHTHAPR